mgnify:FL=1
MFIVRAIWAFIKRIFWPVAILSVAVGAFAFMMESQEKPEPEVAEEKAWSVNALAIEKQTLRPELEVLTEVKSQFPYALTANTQSQVSDILVQPGQLVEKGQTLVVLNNQNQQADLQRLLADVKDLKAQINQTERQHTLNRTALKSEETLLAMVQKELDRQLNIQKQNLTTRTQVEDAQRQFEQQRLAVAQRRLQVDNHSHLMNQLSAQLEKLEIGVTQARQALADTKILAPIAGVITQVHVQHGQLVSQGTPVADLYNPEQLELTAQLPRSLLAKVMGERQTLGSYSLQGWIELPAGDRQEIALQRLSGQVDEGHAGQQAIFHLSEPAPGLVPGHILTAHLYLSPIQQAVAIPNLALFDSNKVFVIDEQAQRIQSTDVRIVGRTTEFGEEQYLVLAEHLNTGDRILTTRLANAVSGLKVAVFGDAHTEDPTIDNTVAEVSQ